MWEAPMMVRLIASNFPIFTPDNGARIWGARIRPPALPVDTLKGMIRLNSAAYRLSLPLSVHANNRRDHDQKSA